MINLILQLPYNYFYKETEKTQFLAVYFVKLRDF